MADGQYRAVEDIMVGDRIASPCGDRTVVALDSSISTGLGKPKAILEVWADGQTHRIECTANHPFLLPDTLDEPRFGAVMPNQQGNARIFHPVVDNEGNRSSWFRGNRGDVDVLRVGDKLATVHGHAVITAIEIQESAGVGERVITPVTGGLLWLSGDVLASAGYDADTVGLDDPAAVRKEFTVRGSTATWEADRGVATP
ncbi:MAG: hypothetical protein OXU42_03990 [Deltaproteobacteria bacterium]|nr:hypothetical protein [Deltaproteobacteria bacterium]